MGPLCAACLLAARLASAEDAAAQAAAPAPTAAPDDAPAPSEPTARAPSPTRLALRDPFAQPHGALPYRTPASPDLIDPFTRPPSDAPARARDLRDPFVDGAPRRCLPSLAGVPVQRPRQLPRTTVPCTIDTPLVNPFTPRRAATAG